jgi:anti-anti-sigma factor
MIDDCKGVAMTGSGPEGTGLLPGGVEVDDAGNPGVVRLWGEHDFSTVESVSSALRDAVAVADRAVIVDLAEVTFIDASILGVLAHSQQLLAARGNRLSVRSPHRMPRKVLEICCLADLIDAEPSGGSVHDHEARTALETWIDVPAAAPLPTTTPVARRATSRGDPEATRR